jgi:hypothetical protein
VNGWGGQDRPPPWRQPVGWGALHETPPIITAPVVRESPGDWLFNGLLRPAWAYRLELALLGLVAGAYVWLGERLGRQGAERLIVAARLPGRDGDVDPRAAGPCPVPLPPAAAVGAGLSPRRAGHPQ